MSFLRNRIRHDENGAALILALAFMLVAGLIAATLLPKITSSSNDRLILDSARNRQYDADAAMERSIARVRTATPVAGECSTTSDTSAGVNSPVQQYRVDCANNPSVSVGGTGAPVSQKNVSFAACINTSVCTAATTTSTSSLVIGTGSKTFTTPTGLPYPVGAKARATANASGGYMEGSVTASTATSVTINVNLKKGSGSFAAWKIRDPDLMITAQVNYQVVNSRMVTFVQSWSVNK